MKGSRINRNSLNNLLALSCVENYTLAALSENNINISLLYYNSYVPFEEAFYDFHNNNIEYAYFDSLPRLQKVAEENNIIELCGSSNQSVKEIEKYEYYSLIGVKLDVFIEKYNTRPWRDDHYIYIDKLNDKEYYFLNDNPRDDGLVSSSHIEELFNGEIVHFKILRGISFKKSLEFLNEFFKDIKRELAIESINIYITEDNLVKTRDFLGVLRVSRKRIQRFLNNFINVEFMNDYLKMLDKCYLTVEYARMRKKISKEVIVESMRAIQENDKLIIEKIISEVGEYI